jgi:hypothetical protein
MERYDFTKNVSMDREHFTKNIIHGGSILKYDSKLARPLMQYFEDGFLCVITTGTPMCKDDRIHFNNAYFKEKHARGVHCVDTMSIDEVRRIFINTYTLRRACLCSLEDSGLFERTDLTLKPLDKE